MEEETFFESNRKEPEIKIVTSQIPESPSKLIEKARSSNSLTSEVVECDNRELGYGAGDALFASVVVAPLVVAIWRSTWSLMDMRPEMFPFAQSYVLGIVVHICFALVRSQLLQRSKGAWRDRSAGRWLVERCLSRVYTYVFILACITHWRGGWGLLDATVAAILPNEEDPHRPVLIAAIVLFCYISMLFLRSSRNFLAIPYFLVTDGKEATYLFTTRFKTTVST